MTNRPDHRLQRRIDFARGLPSSRWGRLHKGHCAATYPIAPMLEDILADIILEINLFLWISTILFNNNFKKIRSHWFAGVGRIFLA